RDLQEDNEGLCDAIDTFKLTLATMSAMLTTLKPKEKNMSADAADPALEATDLAEWLVKHGTPFREAHRQVGGFVAFCNQKGIKLNEASLDDMKTVIPTATAECLALFNPRKSVEGRALEGGTAPVRVAEQIASWQELLKE
ncbi:MAG: hypothetical protein J5743_13045, partial [Victivallales bacterium]|nr:hypothetical protein [Victivallales bacterium]